jgi:hypothetical protein
MPALVGVIERLHLYFFDSLVRGITDGSGIALNGKAVSASEQLFNHGSNQPAWTNFQGNGQFPGDRTYQIKALRVGLFFRATSSAADPAVEVHKLYMQSEMQLYWKLWTGDKFMFVSQTSYLPLGAGIWGDIGGHSDLVVMNNGLATEDALLRLGRSIPIPPRQPFYVEANIYEMGQGENSLIYNLNADTALEAHIFFAIDGIATREAQ